MSIDDAVLISQGIHAGVGLMAGLLSGPMSRFRHEGKRPLKGKWEPSITLVGGAIANGVMYLGMTIDPSVDAFSLGTHIGNMVSLTFGDFVGYHIANRGYDRQDKTSTGNVR